MEPEWTKQISSETICTFFYVFFVFYAVLAGLSVLGLLATLFSMKKVGPGGPLMAGGYTLMTLLAATMALFYYLICDRGLLQGKKANRVEQFVGRK
jgi:hypothetical protein